MSMEGVRVAVVGDQGTGKSSLIDAVGRRYLAEKDPPVLRTARLPAEICPDRVPITIVEISSSVDNHNKLHEELKLADAVVLTYACDQPETLYRLKDFWLPEFFKLEVKVPVIVAGCKVDTVYHEEIRQEHVEVLESIMLQFPQVEFWTKCSAHNLFMVDCVFIKAQRAVVCPKAPLFDRESETLKLRCVRALKRIFRFCDQDGDEALKNSEFDFFMFTCFEESLGPLQLEQRIEIYSMLFVSIVQ